MKLKKLEMTLQRLLGFTRPRPSLERSQTGSPRGPVAVPSPLMNGDIEGKRVCNLGSGTGVLAIGAALLGAASVVGIEIDETAVGTARANADLPEADVEFIVANADDPTLPDNVGACTP